MAKYIEERELSRATTVDLTGKAGYAIAIDTANANQVTLANAQTLPIIGILLTEGKANDVVTTIMGQEGTARVIYGGTVAIGDKLTADANGKLITTTTAGDQVIAIALEAGSAGEYHEAMMMKGWVH